MGIFSDPALKPMGVPDRPAKWTEAYVIDQVDYSQDREGFLERGFSQLFIVPADGGTARQITFGEYDDVSGGITWTRDSKKIIFSSYQKPEAEYARGQSNLYSVDINNLEINELTTVTKVSHLMGFTMKMYVMNIDGSDLECVTSTLDQTPSSAFWASNSLGVYFNVKKQCILICVN